MIKKIGTSELQVGMYVHDLDAGWMEHPFFASHFLIKDEQTIQRIASAGLRQVYIDTTRGKDIDAGLDLEDVRAEVEQQLHRLDEPAVSPDATVPATVEIQRARRLYRETTTVVRNLMSSTRSGRQVDVASLDPLAERMVQSAFRNPHALTGISRIKTKDEYTFMHCVGVSALMVSFARELELPEQQIHDVAVGGLVHDIGKSMVPQEVLNKPDKLNDQEFAKMRDHVTFSRQLLEDLPGISQTALDVALLHHERMDGTGYPQAKDGSAISLIGRMSAIVDVYDALTSVRVYKNAWEPTLAMRKLVEWSPDHFDAELVQRFVRCIGIYPVGATVALDSGRVGIVIDQGQKLIEPVVRIVYNRKHRHYERPVDLDLSRTETDRIVEAVDPRKFDLDTTQFI
jgi:HD-GYP domain-containing protein (c-di-GMP phosphodiesterase class II)